MNEFADTTDAATIGSRRRLIWPLPLWPVPDQVSWREALTSYGVDELDNLAHGWSARTCKKNEDGYGRYLSWLAHTNLLAAESPGERITQDRVLSFIEGLKKHLAPVSVGLTIGSLHAAAKAFSPAADWRWLGRRYSRLKIKAKPSRDKHRAIQHSLDLYNYGKWLMMTADDGPGGAIRAAQRFQAGLIIALLAARPLRIRNFQAIAIGTSLRWVSKHYVLTFDCSKTGEPIDEPCPSDLTPYIDAFLRERRPVLLRQATKLKTCDPTHARLWVDRAGRPLQEPALRYIIKTYTAAKFGTAVWPHLFRDCLLTTVATDQPDLIRVATEILGHRTTRTGEKHYNQAKMLEASRRFGLALLELRQEFLDGLQALPG